MNYKDAMSILRKQEKELKKCNDLRLYHKGYEYRLKYMPGFAPCVAIDRREVGRRNFKYFKTLDVSKVRRFDDLMTMVNEILTNFG